VVKSGNHEEFLEYHDVDQVTRILEHEELNDLEKRVEVAYQNVNLNESPNYQLIVEANNMCMVLTEEILKIYKFLKHRYSKRFPELSQLVVHPLDYARTVRIIKNDTDSVPDLSGILPQSNIISISMTASSTSGQKLEEDELEIILKACDRMMEIDTVRVKIFTYVESQMDNYAPNLTALVGPEIAAKLLGSAGGIDNLAKMPSGNLKLLGKKVVVLDGFSTMNAPIHVGYINDCDLIQRCPGSLKKN